MLVVSPAQLTEVVRAAVRAELEAAAEREKPKKLLSRDEVCELLGISKPTLWQKTKSGEINATHIGRRVLYSQEEVKRLGRKP